MPLNVRRCFRTSCLGRTVEELCGGTGGLYAGTYTEKVQGFGHQPPTTVGDSIRPLHPGQVSQTIWGLSVLHPLRIVAVDNQTTSLNCGYLSGYQEIE